MVLKETPTVISDFFPVSHKVTPSSFPFLFIFLLPFTFVFDLKLFADLCYDRKNKGSAQTVCMWV